MNILLQFPTLGRPNKFLDCLGLYLDLSSGNHSLEFNVNCEADDSLMNQDAVQQAILDMGQTCPHVTINLNYDNNGDKISAINAHVEDKEFDIVICLSDDMIPHIEGWDETIVEAMQEHFPDLDGCVHFNDGYTNGDLITLSILGARLYEHFGYIYHPDYKGLYCDNEFTQQVTAMKKVQYIDKMIIKHEHYGESDNKNSGEIDFAAQKTLRFAGRDQAVFLERERQGFPQGKITND